MAFRIVALLVTLTAFAANFVAPTPDDRYPFVRNNKLGYIDATGREVIPPRFGRPRAAI